MATSIRQRILFRKPVPVGQDLIFSLKNDGIVNNEIQVKFVAQVHISDGEPPNLASTDDLIGTFKTVPNNAGAGIFNFRDIIESFVSSDNLTAFRALVKGEDDEEKNGGTYPLHIIDKFSRNRNLARHFAVQFHVEFLDQTVGSPTFNEIVQADFRNSSNHFIFNGYVFHDDTFQIGGPHGNSFGFDMRTHPNNYELGSSTQARFMTNMPVRQFVNAKDYGTLLFFRNDTLDRFRITWTTHSGTGSSAFTLLLSSANGASSATNLGSNIQRQFIYLGCGPANIRQYISAFDTLLTAGDIDFYTITPQNNSNVQVGNTMRFTVNCPTLKGFEPIRLCWLNQWGGWDYYTFNMKSTKTFTTKGSTYNQLGGSWDKVAYKLNSFKGGMKSFRMNTTEKITINTDYISEEEGKAFEVLINSPEVRILTDYVEETSSEFDENANNNYVIPCRLTTQSITRKTKANDNLIQFTFEIEKTKILRTQSI